MRACCFFLLLANLVLLTLGCDRQTQYAILTTVFTGVPPMEELYAEDEPEAPGVDVQQPAEVSLQAVYRHPLWEAGQCLACHEPSGTVDTSAATVVDELDPGSGVERPGMPEVGALVLPTNKLCLKCHLDKTARRAIRKRLWLHNPVAQGQCLICHSEHESSNVVQLRQQSAELCAGCHETEQLAAECLSGRTDEQGRINCLSCHNTHVGKDSRLLRSDFSEKKIPAVSYTEPSPDQTPSPSGTE